MGSPAEKAWMLSAMSCSSLSTTSNRYARMGPSVASALKSRTTTPSTVRTMPMGCRLGTSPSARPGEMEEGQQQCLSWPLLCSLCSPAP